MSDITKGYKKKYIILKVISFLLLFLPVLIFMIVAFIKGTSTQKVTLGIGVTISVIFMIANILFKLAPRSTFWILIITLTIAIQKISDVIFVTGTCVIIEECIINRLADYYGNKYRINKEIDERIGP